MSDYTLPDGFSWIDRDNLLIRHDESGRDILLSRLSLAVDSHPASVQSEINYVCARAAQRHRLDALWIECGHDKGVFASRRHEVSP